MIWNETYDNLGRLQQYIEFGMEWNGIITAQRAQLDQEGILDQEWNL